MRLFNLVHTEVMFVPQSLRKGSGSEKDNQSYNGQEKVIKQLLFNQREYNKL